MSYDPMMSVSGTGIVAGESKFLGEHGVAWFMNEALVCPMK